MDSLISQPLEVLQVVRCGLTIINTSNCVLRLFWIKKLTFCPKMIFRFIRLRSDYVYKLWWMNSKNAEFKIHTCCLYVILSVVSRSHGDLKRNIPGALSSKLTSGQISTSSWNNIKHPCLKINDYVTKPQKKGHEWRNYISMKNMHVMALYTNLS